MKMGLFDKKEIQKKKTTYGTYVPVTEAMKGKISVPALTANAVWDVQKYGVEHPFDYSVVEGLYSEFGLVTAVVDKLVDFVWGNGFYTKSKDERAKDIIDMWVEDVEFETTGRYWLKQALLKGFSPLELSGKIDEVPEEVKVLNADSIYIKQDDKGKILGFTQVLTYSNKITKQKPSDFNTYEIAHLSINRVNDSPYGLGIIKPNVKMINWYLQNLGDLHSLIKRKANAPVVVTMGNREKDEYPDQTDIDAFGQKLQYMDNRTEWVVGDNIRMAVLDFGKASDKFDSVLRTDFENLIFGFQTPEVLLGQGNIPEGLAGVQIDAYERKAKSIQKELEKVIEQKIFSRILIANKISSKVDFIWGQPSKEEENIRIAQITTLLSNMMLPMGLRTELECQLADLMKIDKDKIEESQTPEQRLLNQPQPKVPGTPQNESYEGKHYLISKPVHKKECGCVICKTK